MIHFNNIKIISGGQTGADLGGLIGAKLLGLETGGVAPKGFLTSVGNNPTIKIGDEYYQLADFGLIARGSYASRTFDNVKNSDITIILAYNEKSSGTLLTIKYCQQLGKPFVVIDPNSDDASYQFLSFLGLNNFCVVNIAGNREQKGQEAEAVFTAHCAEIVYFSFERYLYASNSIKGF